LSGFRRGSIHFFQSLSQEESHMNYGESELTSIINHMGLKTYSHSPALRSIPD
jgi:hypothetical protein